MAAALRGAKRNKWGAIKIWCCHIQVFAGFSLCPAWFIKWCTCSDVRPTPLGVKGAWSQINENKRDLRAGRVSFAGVKGSKGPRSSSWIHNDNNKTPPAQVKFLVTEVNNARERERERERCERGGGRGGGAGNELNSGKLHLQGSPPVYNESV